MAKREQNGFRVPKDLAALPLTIGEVTKVLGERAAQRKAQARIDGLPAREQKYRDEIKASRAREDDILTAALERDETAKAAAK